jgi:hypothetical protein
MTPCSPVFGKVCGPGSGWACSNKPKTAGLHERTTLLTYIKLGKAKDPRIIPANLVGKLYARRHSSLLPQTNQRLGAPEV